VGELGLDAAEAGLSEEHNIKLLNILAKYYQCKGKNWEEAANNFLKNLKMISKEDPKLAVRVIDWLNELPLVASLQSLNPIVKGIELLGQEETAENMLSAWRILDEEGVNKLFKVLEMTVELKEKKEVVLSRLWSSIKSEDTERIKFTLGILSLTYDGRRLIEEPYERERFMDSMLNIEESGVEFGTKKMSIILDIVNEIINKENKMKVDSETMKTLDRFEAQLIKVDEESIDSLLNAWENSFKIEGSFVSRINEYRKDSFRISMPLLEEDKEKDSVIRYLLAIDKKDMFVIPLRGTNEEKSTTVFIPSEVINYLKLKDGDFVVLSPKNKDINIKIPVVLDQNNRISFTDWFKRLFPDYVDKETDLIKWDELNKRSIEYVVEGRDTAYDDEFPLEGKDRIRIQVSKSVAEPGEYALIVNPRLKDAFDFNAYLSKWLEKVKGFTHEIVESSNQEMMKLKVVPEDKVMFDQFYVDVMSNSNVFDDQRKGVIACKIVAKVIEALRKELNIPDDTEIIVDPKGFNTEGYYFDIFAKVVEEKDGEKIVRFVWIAEVKSDWTGWSEKKETDYLLRDALKTLRTRLSATINELGKYLDKGSSTKEGWVIALKIIDANNPMEGFETELKKVKVDWVKGEVKEIGGD